MLTKISTDLKTSIGVKAALRSRLEFSAILNLPESQFARMISELEKDPLFQKLLFPPDKGPRAVFQRRYPHTSISQSFFEIKEELNADAGVVDVEGLLQKREGLIRLIRRIGQENFKRYFLYREEPASPETIAQLCGITPDDARKIQSLLTEISVHSEFFHPSVLPAAPSIRYSAIAKIEPEDNGSFMISFLSPHLACGRYVINRERVEAIKTFVSDEERKSLSEIIKKVNLINLRQDTVHKILNEMVASQEAYLRTGNEQKFLPLPQREVARRIGVAPSTVSRAVFGKSVILPWGVEEPLKNLFLSRKDAVLLRLREILKNPPDPGKSRLKDDQLKELLLKRYRMAVSRRSINLYRRELQFEK